VERILTCTLFIFRKLCNVQLKKVVDDSCSASTMTGGTVNKIQLPNPSPYFKLSARDNYLVVLVLSVGI
jgi:hypothetical protein